MNPSDEWAETVACWRRGLVARAFLLVPPGWGLTRWCENLRTTPPVVVARLPRQGLSPPSLHTIAEPLRGRTPVVVDGVQDFFGPGEFGVFAASETWKHLRRLVVGAYAPVLLTGWTGLEDGAAWLCRHADMRLARYEWSKPTAPFSSPVDKMDPPGSTETALLRHIQRAWRSVGPDDGSTPPDVLTAVVEALGHDQAVHGGWLSASDCLRSWLDVVGQTATDMSFALIERSLRAVARLPFWDIGDDSTRRDRLELARRHLRRKVTSAPALAGADHDEDEERLIQTLAGSVWSRGRVYRPSILRSEASPGGLCDRILLACEDRTSERARALVQIIELHRGLTPTGSLSPHTLRAWHPTTLADLERLGHLAWAPGVSRQLLLRIDAFVGGPELGPHQSQLVCAVLSVWRCRTFGNAGPEVDCGATLPLSAAAASVGTLIGRALEDPPALELMLDPSANHRWLMLTFNAAMVLAQDPTVEQRSIRNWLAAALEQARAWVRADPTGGWMGPGGLARLGFATELMAPFLEPRDRDIMLGTYGDLALQVYLGLSHRALDAVPLTRDQVQLASAALITLWKVAHWPGTALPVADHSRLPQLTQSERLRAALFGENPDTAERVARPAEGSSIDRAPDPTFGWVDMWRSCLVYRDAALYDRILPLLSKRIDFTTCGLGLNAIWLADAALPEETS